MENPNICAHLPEALLPWYDNQHRDLPWRRDRDPYHVWLSEIMLQQTRVEAAVGYYARFLEAVPDIPSLAACPDDALHKLWEGLGYYSRVRNLKKAANRILDSHEGKFPEEYAAVRALPGIGDYTAGAVCSICFDLPTPAVDGNVLRLVSRLTADRTPIDSPAFKRQVRQMLAAVYPARAGDFTQALIELGATLCGPNRKPDCAQCPCRSFCRGYALGCAEELPVRAPKKGRRTEEKTVFLLHCEGKVALQKRPDTGLLAGLWQLPELPGTLEVASLSQALAGLGLQLREIRHQADRSHIFTHIQWNMRGFFLEVATQADTFAWFMPRQIESQTALPTAFRQFWELWQSELQEDINYEDHRK